jgi:hypothetical protein
MGEPTQIANLCTTTRAGVQVRDILFAVGLKPRFAFQRSPVLSTMPPIVFTIDPALLDGQLKQIRVILDTTITYG